jgi:hypothetical protein
MNKKDYYTYNNSNTSYINNGNTAINIYPNHISVLELDFSIGDLIETSEKKIGIIIGVSDSINHIYYYLGCKVYKIQMANEIKICGSLSIKKIKKI